MKTSELEELIYQKLKENLNEEVEIYHNYAVVEEVQKYPVVVYSMISDVAVNFLDDVEKSHRVTIRIHIITEDGEYYRLYDEVNCLMQELKLTRQQTITYIEEEKKILIIDYQKLLEVK